MDSSTLDPDIRNIILGVIGNALTALIAKTGSKLSKQPAVTTDEIFNQLLDAAVATTANDFQWDGQSHEEEVALFLYSPEVQNTLRQLFAASIAKRSTSLRDIEHSFCENLAFYLLQPASDLITPASILFSALIKGCEVTLRAALKQEGLVAMESINTLRQQVLLDELSGISQQIAFLQRKSGKPTFAEVAEFELNWRKQIRCRHGFITPPHLDAAKKFPIDDLYVCPTFHRSKTPSRQEDDTRIALYPFIASAHRHVILGNPGGGKSTLAARICFDLASRFTERLFAGRELTPIHVTMRDYGATKAEKQVSILQFINSVAVASYQVQPPAGAFEYMLLNGRALVIFDGLDELLNTAYRREITADVESFCTMFPETPVLVTSREVGYSEAPLDPRRFDVVRLAEMDETQVTAYVENWFKIDPDLIDSEKQKRVKAFVEESRHIPDLRANPLMLGLMCTIYRGENYIPRNRPDLYEKCATMLFDRWDKGRGIEVVLPIEAHVRPAMMHLAHWMYTNAKDSGVTESALIEAATLYLHDRQFDDVDEARHAASEFVRFCRGRAWVFTDTGTTPNGEALFQFTHRTFLEYFTAQHLVRKYRTPKELSAILLPRIAKSEWEVVSQLAIQIQNKNIEGAGDEIIGKIVAASGKRSPGTWSLLSFAARCLRFLVLHPEITRSVVKAGFDRWFELGIRRQQGTKALPKYLAEIDANPEWLATLVAAAKENQQVIGRAIRDALWTRASSDDHSTAALAVSVSQNLCTFGAFENETVKKMWMEIVIDFNREFNPKITLLCQTHLSLCSDRLIFGQLSFEEFFKYHSIQSAFSDVRSPMYGFGWWPILDRLVYHHFGPRVRSDTSESTLATKAEWTLIGYHMEQLCATPIHEYTNKFFPWDRRDFNRLQLSTELTNFGRFGLFCYFAVSAESVYQQLLSESSSAVALGQMPMFEGTPFGHLIEARFRRQDSLQIEPLLRPFAFTSAHATIIEKWIMGEVSFLV